MAAMTRPPTEAAYCVGNYLGLGVSVSRDGRHGPRERAAPWGWTIRGAKGPPSTPKSPRYYVGCPTLRSIRKDTYRGPRGEKRPADVLGAAVLVAKIATGAA
jgi:hypothetical protein